MDIIEQRLWELGYKLPVPPAPKGAYLPVSRWGGLLFSSGTGSNVNGVRLYTGKVGRDVTVEQAQESARLALLNNLANIRAAVGSLEPIRILKLNGYVNCAEGFDRQAAVIDGASQMLETLFGEKGRHARVAVGVYELPFHLSVEIELIATVEE